IQTPIADMTVIEDSPNIRIDIATIFTDSDSPDQSIAKMLLKNTNESLVTAAITGNNLDLMFQTNAFGSATMTIRGSSQGKIVDQSFTITVTPVDDSPIIVNPLDDITVNENPPETSIDLSTVFTDPDNNDQDIVKTLINNDNESLLSGKITGNQLILSYGPDTSGTATINIRATSGGKMVDDSFVVTVKPVDDPPVDDLPVIHAITDIVVDENASDMLIDLTPLFTDIDNNEYTIRKSIVSNSNESLVSPIITGDLLVLSFVPNASGTATLVVRALSGEKSIERSFNVVVMPVDNPPIIATHIQPMIVNEDAPEQIVDLSSVFTDPDDYDTNIQLAITNNTNSKLLAANIIGQTIRLRYLPDQSGSAILTIRGTSNGLFVEDQLTITVNGVDDPPVVANPISDKPMDINDELLIIDLTNVFMDCDTKVMTKTILNNTNPQLATASIIENNLNIAHQAGLDGETDITIIATSKGQMAKDTFKIFVNATDIAPELSTPINDILVLEDSDNTIIDL
ncbi:peptidase, partial [Candidatus Magnetomorum sp. HK-1]